MAGRVLFENERNRIVELSQSVEGSGSGVETVQRSVAFSPYHVAFLYHVSSQEGTKQFELSFDEIETLYAAMQEYKPLAYSADDLQHFNDYPF